MTKDDKVDAFITKWDFVIFWKFNRNNHRISIHSVLCGNYNVSFYMFKEEKNRKQLLFKVEIRY